ncbi:MAG TPA: DJ-1/PfpI family protein [Actinomycetota bacterium]|nr:DJ-1/PfpI family protein [Actinomycetota bacterium]
MTTIGFILYPRFTALDFIGPYEVLSRLPGHHAVVIAETNEPVLDEQGPVAVTPEFTFENAPPLDVLLVPGGPGQLAQMGNQEMRVFLRGRAEKATLVTSVCTGALILGDAGLLEGKRATTHWLAYGALEGLGATPVAERIVRDGKVITAAGVSAGIDLGLLLAAEIAGETIAQAIQLGIEYDPQPPFDAGSPAKAPPKLVEAMRANARIFLG